MPEEKRGDTVLGGIRKLYHRARSRSPDRGKKSGFGSSLSSLPLEISPIDSSAQTPKLFNQLILCLRPHLSVDGLFRQCAPKLNVNLLRAKAESGRLDETTEADAHALAVLLKTWLRELPQGLIPESFQRRLLSSANEAEVRSAIDSLPTLNHSTVSLLFNFLSMVANTVENRMTANALAVCVGPSLFRVTANNEGLLTQNKANEMAHKFIKNYSIFFKSNLDSNDNSSQLNSPSENRQERNISSDFSNGKNNISTPLTPPTTPPTSPTPDKTSPSFGRAVEELVNRFFDDEEVIKSDGHSTAASEDSSKKLKLPARSAPVRGSRKKPSRMHRQKMSTSQESLQSKNSQKAESAVFDRFKDGDSLEGWRQATPSSPSSEKSIEIQPAGQPQNTPQITNNILIPKLDLSTVVNQQNSPSPIASPTQVPKVEISPEVEKKLVKKTPIVSPEPLLSKRIMNKSSPLFLGITPTTPLPMSSLMRSIEDVAKSANHPTISRHHSADTRSRPTKQQPKPLQNGELKVDRPGRARKSRTRQIRPKTESPSKKEPVLDHVEHLTNAVRDLEGRMTERRQVSGRSNNIAEMSELQLREEKSELQRELLVLEGEFGRPQAGPERQAVRMIYHRYRELKRKLSEYDNRQAADRESFLREIESELSKIERERRDLGRTIKNWESRYRAENDRNPSNDEKLRNHDYNKYRHLKARRNFLQELQQQTQPDSFTV